MQPYNQIVDSFFAGQNLQLPPGTTWNNVNANIFKIIDGKRILFEDEDSLFRQLAAYGDGNLKINRQRVARNMASDELHKDIVDFFDSLNLIVNPESE